MEAVAFVGGAFLSSLFDWMFGKLDSFPLLNFNKRNKTPPAELEEWRSLLPKIQAVLDHAEAQQMDDVSVEMWLSDLKELAYDMEDILDEFEFEEKTSKLLADAQAGSSRASKRPRLGSSRRDDPMPNFDALLPKIKEVTSNLQRIDKDKIVFHFQHISRQAARSVGARTPSTCLVEPHFYGRDKDIEAILELLLRDEPAVCVVPVVGMGGLGKTTLAQRVYNDQRVRNRFNLRAWVCVSEEFDILKVTRSILQGIRQRSCDLNDDLNSLQTKLKEKLGGKKFFLVLDDVWNENYEQWDILRRPFFEGAAGSKIMVTTRKHGVASVMAMGRISAYALETLPNDQCLRLFCRHALDAENFEAHPQLEAIGKEIVMKCKGLPLAAKTLGGLLRCNFEMHYWEYILNSKIWELPKEKSNILPALRLSYHDLPSRLKRCFVYCAMFPKHYEFNKDRLVLLWMAEGFLKQPDGRKLLIEDLCRESFDELLSRGFLQQSSVQRSRFVMHDLIHDLALSIAGESCCHLPRDLDGDQLQRASFKNARHFSFSARSYDTLKRFDAFMEAQRLRTFIVLPAARDMHLSNAVLHKLLSKFRSLRALSLSQYQIRKIPDSIGNVKLLRSLDLSHSGIQSLPDLIASLIHLEILILLNCRSLTELPATIGNLIELSYLDLTYTRIQSLPESIAFLSHLRTLLLRGCNSLIELPVTIGNLIELVYLDIRCTHKLENISLEIINLPNLQLLSDFIVDRVGRLRLGGLKCISHHLDHLYIKNLQYVQDVQDAMDANLKTLDLKELSLEWTHDPNTQISETNEMQVLNHLKPDHNLEMFEVSGYGGSGFPSWIGDLSFCNLTYLEIRNCNRISSLPSVGQLPSLEKLIIFGMEGVQVVGMEFYGMKDSSLVSRSFLALKRLQFENMPAWEEWLCFDGTDAKACQRFPRLEVLILWNCPKLRGNLPTYIPSLMELKICGCPQLIPSRVSPPPPCDLSIEISRHTLTLDGISGPTCLPNRIYQAVKSVLRCINLRNVDPFVDMKDFKNLRTLRIYDSPRLESFTGCKLPMMLKEFEIRNCENLKFLPEEIMHHDDRNSFVCLEALGVWNCPRLQSFPIGKLPATLESITLVDCKNLRLLPEAVVGADGNILTNIYIDCCPNLRILHFWWTQRLDRLKMFRIEVSSLNDKESFPESSFFVPNIKLLHILSFKNLKSLPEFHNLPSLANLSIQDCPRVVALPRGGFPPNLSSLHIGCRNINQLMYEWGLHNLTALQDLSIDHVCPPDGLQLPPHLKRLELGFMKEVKSISRRLLQNLTCLQVFKIRYCPKLEHLPKDLFLPPSLEQFKLYNCPLLEDKCKDDSGEYWPLIAHIPRVVTGYIRAPTRRRYFSPMRDWAL